MGEHLQVLILYSYHHRHVVAALQTSEAEYDHNNYKNRSERNRYEHNHLLLGFRESCRIGLAEGGVRRRLPPPFWGWIKLGFDSYVDSDLHPDLSPRVIRNAIADCYMEHRRARSLADAVRSRVCLCTPVRHTSPFALRLAAAAGL